MRRAMRALEQMPSQVVDALVSGSLFAVLTRGRVPTRPLLLSFVGLPTLESKPD
jgi:hypothetical protein